MALRGDRPLTGGERHRSGRRGGSGVSLGRSLVALTLSVAAAGESRADTLTGGSVAVESRLFDPDDVDSTEDAGVAIATRLDVKYRARTWRLALRGFARVDALDDTRNLFALEEANVTYSAGPLSFVVGSQLLNWSTTEAFHPSDVINSRNFDSDIANPEKLGEPMVELQVRFLRGSLSAYYLPVRIAPNVVSSDSRLSLLPPGIQLGDALWVDRDGAPSDSLFAHQGAVRLVQTIGSTDISIHLVDHNDRNQPTFTPDPETGELRPTYHTVTQAGLNYVQAFGGLLVKLEAAMRIFRPPDAMTELAISPQRSHEIAALGLEYSWATASGQQATVIAESQLVNQSKAVRAQLEPFQRDVLIGYRHSFNDVMGRNLLLLFIADAEKPTEYVTSVSYEQRLNDQWNVSGLVRSLRLFGRDLNGIELRLTRSF